MISIIIVNHNGERHLAHTLAQLATTPHPAHEIIVVDNASTDGSRAMVRRQHPDVRLVPLDTNLGFGAANNRGVAVAEGRQLLLLNSDAWPAPGAVDRLGEALDDDPRLGLVAPQLRYPDGRLQFTWVPETGVLGEAVQMVRNRFEASDWNHRWLPPLLRRLTGPGWYSGACLMVRRDAYEAIGGFDEAIFLYFEDVDLCRRLRRAGWRLGGRPAATVFHVKGGSVDRHAFDYRYRQGQLAYYAKHRPAWELRFLRRRLRRKFRHLHDDHGHRLRTLIDGPYEANERPNGGRFSASS